MSEFSLPRLLCGGWSRTVWGLIRRLVRGGWRLLDIFSGCMLRRERLDQIAPENEIENEVKKERRSKRILVAVKECNVDVHASRAAVGCQASAQNKLSSTPHDLLCSSFFPPPGLPPRLSPPNSWPLRSIPLSFGYLLLSLGIQCPFSDLL